MTRFSLAFLFLSTLLGCSGSGAGVNAGPMSPPEADVTGAWTARWLSKTGVGGGSSFAFTQSGNRVTGEVRFTGSPCFSGGQFEGTLSGRELSGSLVAGAIEVALSATVSSGSLDGTYVTVQAGACTGDTGTFTATR